MSANPLSAIAKSVAAEFRRVAEAVEQMAQAANHAETHLSPEGIAADALERLAKALRAKAKRR